MIKYQARGVVSVDTALGVAVVCDSTLSGPILGALDLRDPTAPYALRSVTDPITACMVEAHLKAGCN